jgi:hypothetical protein
MDGSWEKRGVQCMICDEEIGHRGITLPHCTPNDVEKPIILLNSDLYVEPSYSFAQVITAVEECDARAAQ